MSVSVAINVMGLVSVGIFLLFSVGYSIDDKCAACNAVAGELERGLSNEKPRNHLDMRYRLDSKGQREGKVIDYRVSELRVVELLDGLCEKMQDYTWREVDSAKYMWIKVDEWDNLTSKQEARAYSKDISSYCGRLLEETEDEVGVQDLLLFHKIIICILVHHVVLLMSPLLAVAETTVKEVKRNMNRLRCFAIKPNTLFLLFVSSSFLFTANHAFNLPSTVAFDDSFTHLFGHKNLVRSSDGNGVRLHLDRSTGSGFNSSSMHHHGFFSANIKLPSGYTAGIVVAFYTTNGDEFKRDHDELDIEFLGNVEGKPWRFQTNVYGNGSVHRGREERFRLWFDPSKEFHRYSILWTTKRIIFYVDDVPIREVVRNEAMGGDYPSKPMSLYATIWDASDWASCGGKCKLDYKYAPFVAEFKDLSIQGCPVKANQHFLSSTICSEMNERLESQDYAVITPTRRTAMRRFRQRFMYYSYCYDTKRYPVPLPECVVDTTEKQRFKEDGQLKFEGSHRRRRNPNKRKINIPGNGVSGM